MANKPSKNDQALQGLYGLGGLTWGYRPLPPAPKPTTPSEYLAAGLGFVPGIGDIAGLAGDAKMYMTRPEERTWGNAAMTALGALPFVPAASAASLAAKLKDVEPDYLIDAGMMVEKVNPTNKNKVLALVDSMRNNGWEGRPIVVFNSASSGRQALTGSHRIEAAKKAGISIPAIEVDDQVYDYIDDYGNSIEDIFGTGDDKVAKFLYDAGDARAAEFLEAEPFD